MHKYKSSTSGAWVLDENGDAKITGGILTSRITNNGTFNLKDGTICGVTGKGVEGCAINNMGTATIEKMVQL